MSLARNLDLPAYFMIKRCFENNANHVDVAKCQTPSDYDGDDNDDEVMLPVISSDTGRIYWNSYCARCMTMIGIFRLELHQLNLTLTLLISLTTPT